MCNQLGHRNPIYCIIPEHIWLNIAERGDERQRATAFATLREDHLLRGYRNEILAARASARINRIRQFRQQRGQQAGRPAWWTRFQAGAVDCSNDLERRIYATNNTRKLPGVLMRSEGDLPTGDVAVDNAYEFLGDTFDFYCQQFDRDSLDNQGLILDATVHYGKNYDNAYWDGTQMVFGDGGIFKNGFVFLDIVAHELTHGVTENEAAFVYANQSGALNESMSDVMAEVTEQWKLQQTVDEANWLIGEGLFNNTNLQGTALRSMIAPGTAYDDPVLGKDPQPDHMDDYLKTSADNGGVHTNSGIPNHAFYLAATNIGGFAWEGAGLVWYNALTTPDINPNMQFRSFAILTIRTAINLFGRGDVVPEAIYEAWREVGVLP